MVGQEIRSFAWRHKQPFYLSLCMRKPTICLCKNKDAVTAKLISAFVFATRIVQSLFLNPKFQASSHLLCLYSPVCVGPGQKPKLLVFSCTGSFLLACKSLVRFISIILTAFIVYSLPFQCGMSIVALFVSHVDWHQENMSVK